MLHTVDKNDETFRQLKGASAVLFRQHFTAIFAPAQTVNKITANLDGNMSND